MTMTTARITSVSTFTATVYAGFRVGRTDDPDARMHTMDDAMAIIRRFATDSEGTPGGCVTVTATEYVYTRGQEPGVAVGFLNYPRFPSESAAIRAKAIELAELLLVGLEQAKVAVEFSDETVMIDRPDAS